MHEAARRVIDEHEQRALWAAVLEPPMLGPVDLHEFADAVTAVTRLVHGLEPLPSVAPEAVGPHPLPDRLDPKMDAVPLGQLLAGECWTEVGVVGRDQSQRLSSERRRIAAVARLASACLGGSRPGPMALAHDKLWPAGTPDGASAASAARPRSP